MKVSKHTEIPFVKPNGEFELRKGFKMSVVLFAVVLSGVFACFTRSAPAGSVVGWGDMYTWGQVTTPAGNDFVAIAAGWNHDLAIRCDGSIVSWGYSSQATPPAGNDYVAIAGGSSHFLALRSDGSIVGWGANNVGQSTPPPGNDYVAIDAGHSHSIALKSDGSIVTWGRLTESPAGNDYIAIAAGENHNLALKSDGSIVGWGSNNFWGQITPPAGNDYVAIATGWCHSTALRSDGSLVGWGANSAGQATPPAGNDFIAISAEENWNVALRSDGSLIAWGDNWAGQINVPAGNSYVAISVGEGHAIALRAPATITVDDDGPADYSTIQAAIDAACDGDEVVVADGTYIGDGNRDIDLRGKAITLRSENGPANCIIDCQGTDADPHRGFYFSNAENRDTVIEGITITNGYMTAGGAIMCRTSPTFINCVISENASTYGGGCSFAGRASYAAMIDCRIIKNSANYGAGMTFDDCPSVLLANCIISENVGATYGGGLFFDNATVIVTNCTIVANEGTIGGGIYYDNDRSALQNCIVWGNTGGSINISPSFVLPVRHSCVEGGWPGLGNIDADPIFINHQLGDYHLQSLSPCINAGDPNYVAEPNETDLDGRPRVIGGRIDMGAYEATIQIEADVRIVPRVINRHGRMTKVLATMRLPEGNTRDQIDSEEPLVLYPGGIESIQQWVVCGREVMVFAFFDEAELMAAVPDNGRVELLIVGQLKTGEFFSGTDTVWIIGMPTDNFDLLARLSCQWVQTGSDLDADLDNNGHVDFKDFALMASNGPEDDSL